MTTPRIPDDLEEIPMENESKQGMSKPFLLKPKNIYTHSKKLEVVKRPHKTRASYMYQIHPSLKNEGMIEVEDFLRKKY